MNLQSENRNRTETERLKYCPEVSYLCRDGSDIRLNGTRFDPEGDQRNNNEQIAVTLKTNYNEECCNKLKKGYKFMVPPYRCNSMLSDPPNTPRDSSESICSQSLHTKTKYSSNSTGNSKIDIKVNQNEGKINQKYDIHTKLTFIDSPEYVRNVLRGKNREKFYTDKTTYCRPVVNLYNQEFLNRTMEKNAKLRRLVTELVIARQKEKDKQNWNNYINNLRKKHNLNAKITSTTSMISDKFVSPDNVEDNTKFRCKHSIPCQNLLQDLYKPNYIRPSDHEYYESLNEHAGTLRGYNPFKTNPLCFPTSSQGRLIILERERKKRLGNNGYKPIFKTINEEKRFECDGQKNIKRKEFGRENFVRHSRSTNTTLTSISTQTILQIIPTECLDVVMTKGCNTNNAEYKKEKCSKEVQNQRACRIQEGKSPENIYHKDNNLRKFSLVSIEEKLDNLIHSINNFIIEMKSKSASYKYLDKNTTLNQKNVNYTRSESCGMARKEKIVRGFIDDSSRTTRNSSLNNFHKIQTIDENLTRINDILLEEIGKNKLITLDDASVGETYHPCSVQISVNIPTKEISTEVTRSLSKAGNLKEHNIVIEEIPSRGDRRITIAINTDPLSLLAMLRVSTEETIRRLLSYVPTIDYYSYLSRLQGPTSRDVESHYVCNICGAAFTKPSALTDHIQKHELGKTRDCCVCRHVLDLPRRRPGLFKCQYCGQRFTRAYCCELHQEACARRLGKQHDVTSSLMLLR